MQHRDTSAAAKSESTAAHPKTERPMAMMVVMRRMPFMLMLLLLYCVLDRLLLVKIAVMRLLMLERRRAWNCGKRFVGSLVSSLNVTFLSNASNILTTSAAAFPQSFTPAVSRPHDQSAQTVGVRRGHEKRFPSGVAGTQSPEH